MSWRDRTRRLLPYVVVGAAGFLIAYLVVFFFVFPSSVVPTERPVPDLSGLQYAAAVRRLADEGFRADTGEQSWHGAAARGIVTGQRPAAGTVEARGALVLLDISLGRRQTRVPEVVGLSEQEARTRLAAEGFAVAEAAPEPGDQPRGTVIASIPAPGQVVTLPASVRLRTSAGPSEVTVPDVTGRPFSEAQAMLQQVGLATGRAIMGSEGSGTPGTVTRQVPAGGESVRAGTAVRLTVAP